MKKFYPAFTLILFLCGCCTTQNETITVALTGEVRNPGGYNLNKGTTLASAIKNAGGLTEWVNLKESYIHRGQEKIPLAADLAPASDFTLLEGDIVVIKRSCGF